jgi:hypothetical protein
MAEANELWMARNDLYIEDELQARRMELGEELELDQAAVDDLFSQGWPSDDDVLNWLTESPLDNDDPAHLAYDPRYGF